MKLRILIKILFIIYTLAALDFYQPLGIVSPEFAKAISYAAMALIWGLAIVCDTTEHHIATFKPNIKWLLVMMVISTVMPTLSYYDQGVISTFIATLPFMSYGLYLAIRKFGIERGFFYRLTFAIITLSIITHIVNLRSFPIIVFGELQDDYELDRGGLRLVIQGFNFIILGFFIAAGEFMRNRRWYWLLPLAVCSAMIFISYTRQHIVGCLILGSWMLLRSCGGKLRQVVIGIAIVGALALILPKIPIVRHLVNITIEQHERNEAANRENVRVVAARYYGWEAFDNIHNRIFGNGVPSYHSKWGMEVKVHAEMENLFTFDVGWFGFNWYFGVIALMLMIAICYKAISPKYNPHSIVGRYYFIWLSATGIISGSLLYQYEIIVTVIALCILDADNEEYEHDAVVTPKPLQRALPSTFGSDIFTWKRIKPESNDETEHDA